MREEYSPRPDVSPQHTIAVVSIAVQGKGTDAKSVAAIQTMRETVVPGTVGKLHGADVGVAGTTANDKDSNDQLKNAAPFVFAFVLAFAFLLMLVTFRSVVIAIKAVLLNLLSAASACGALVLVFQDGWGHGFMGVSATGGIIGFLPIYLFVILFGLSMDYHVFIISRIREGFDRGLATENAVAHGIKSTAGVVTSAALVMFGVFSIFATLQFMFLKQFGLGLGLAIAVLVDATIVRAVLLPASMKRSATGTGTCRSGSPGCPTSTTVTRPSPSRSRRCVLSRTRSPSRQTRSANSPPARPSVTTAGRIRSPQTHRENESR